MKTRFTRAALAAALLASAFAAQAADFSFAGSIDTGSQKGQTFSGSYSYDDKLLKGLDSESLKLSAFSLDIFNLPSLTLSQVSQGEAYADFVGGQFIGLSLSFTSTSPKIAFITDGFSFDGAYLAYDAKPALSGSGSYTINTAAVPEPESWALMLGGLAAMGFLARRQQRV